MQSRSRNLLPSSNSSLMQSKQELMMDHGLWSSLKAFERTISDVQMLGLMDAFRSSKLDPQEAVKLVNSLDIFECG